MKPTPMTNVLRLIGANEQFGPQKSVVVRCPAHDDNEPSLSVTEASDGRVLLYCHAGCKVDEILDVLGLTFPDLFP